MQSFGTFVGALGNALWHTLKQWWLFPLLGVIILLFLFWFFDPLFPLFAWILIAVLGGYLFLSNMACVYRTKDGTSRTPLLGGAFSYCSAANSESDPKPTT